MDSALLVTVAAGLMSRENERRLGPPAAVPLRRRAHQLRHAGERASLHAAHASAVHLAPCQVRQAAHSASEYRGW